MTKPAIKGPLTILGMEVENFKRISVVRLKPDGSLIEIAGDNGQGKSSLLDAIWAALGGAKSFPEDPIRDGQQEATIALDMGEVKVTRKFRRKEEGDPPYTTSLVIEAANGARFDKPQTLMDSLVGSLSFEPMAFMDLDDKAKFDALKVFVPGVDFDAVDGQNKSDFEKRTEENRRAKELRAQAAGIHVLDGKHEAVDVSALLKELEAAEAVNKERADRQARRDKAANNLATLEKDIEDEEKEIAEYEERIRKSKALIQECKDAREHLAKKLAEAPPLPEEVDTAAIRDRLGKAETVNKNARDAQTRDDLLARAESHEKASQALTEAMEARKEEMRAKIAAAELPVPGLSLEEGKVTLNGHPFADASTAEKLRTSIAVAMAMNPTIKVIRITKGGNDLDKKSMKIIADMATEHGAQVWIERVIAAGKPTIIMEDGRAKG